MLMRYLPINKPLYRMDCSLGELPLMDYGRVIEIVSITSENSLPLYPIIHLATQ